MLLSGVLGFLVIVAFAALAAVIVRLVLGTPDKLVMLGLSVPVGGGAFSWFLFIITWAGIPLLPLTRVLVWLLLMVVFVGLQKRGWPRLEAYPCAWTPDRNQLDRWIRLGGWVAFGLLTGLVTFLSVAHAYGSWDTAAGWSAKGYSLAKEGTIFAGGVWGAWRLAFPLNLPIQIGLFYLQSYSLGSTFQQVLTENFDRAFFPAAVLMETTAVRMFASGAAEPSGDSNGAESITPLAAGA